MLDLEANALTRAFKFCFAFHVLQQKTISGNWWDVKVSQKYKELLWNILGTQLLTISKIEHSLKEIHWLVKQFCKEYIRWIRHISNIFCGTTLSTTRISSGLDPFACVYFCDYLPFTQCILLLVSRFLKITIFKSRNGCMYL